MPNLLRLRYRCNIEFIILHKRACKIVAIKCNF